MTPPPPATDEPIPLTADMQAKITSLEKKVSSLQYWLDSRPLVLEWNAVREAQHYKHHYERICRIVQSWSDYGRKQERHKKAVIHENNELRKANERLRKQIADKEFELTMAKVRYNGVVMGGEQWKEGEE
jgi:hypothetical protein